MCRTLFKDQGEIPKSIVSDHNAALMNDGKSNIFILKKWEVIQERFLKVDDNMKIHIKEQLRKIVNLKTTDMKSPSQPVKTKGAPKKIVYTK